MSTPRPDSKSIPPPESAAAPTPTDPAPPHPTGAPATPDTESPLSNPEGEKSTDKLPEPARAARGLFRSRLWFPLLLTVSLLFAGLWLHQKRIMLRRTASVEQSLRQASAAEAQIKVLRALVEQHRTRFRSVNALLGLMADPNTHRWVLDGPEARGQVFLGAQSGRLALFAFALNDPEGDQAYQAWGVSHDGNHHSLGILPDAVEGIRTLFLPAPPDELASIRITLEPKATSDAPAGKVVLEAALLEP